MSDAWPGQPAGSAAMPDDAFAPRRLAAWECEPGKYEQTSPTRACVLCPENTFKTGSGNSSALCEACPNDSVSFADRTSCDCVVDGARFNGTYCRLPRGEQWARGAAAVAVLHGVGSGGRALTASMYGRCTLLSYSIRGIAVACGREPGCVGLVHSGA